MTIREKDHQANRGQLYGKTVKDPKYPFAIMKPVDVRRPHQVHGLRPTTAPWDRGPSTTPSSGPAVAHARSVLHLRAVAERPHRRHVPVPHRRPGCRSSSASCACSTSPTAPSTCWAPTGAYQFVQWLGTGPGRFWWAVLGAALGVALLGGIVERLLFRHLYGKEELYQLLFTYALVLILSDVAKIIWGTQQISVSRPPGLDGSLHALRRDDPVLQPLHPAPRPRASRSPSGSCCTARGRAASSAPPRSTARRWARSASTSTGSTPASS